MQKRYLRRKIGRKMTDEILPNVIKELNLITNNLKVVKVAVSDEDFAEVTLVDEWNNYRRHTVDLVNHKCRCRAWQSHWKTLQACFGLDLVQQIANQGFCA